MKKKFTLFKKLFRSNAIRVQLIEAVSNEPFAVVKLKPEQLPASFDKPTMMHIENEDWEVEKAEPIHADEFIKKGELILWLKKRFKLDPRNVRYSIPTISNELPKLATNYHFYDFTHTIHKDDWRQIEFLPAEEEPLILEEMRMVESIIFPEDNPDFDSTVSGFDKIHVRNKVNRQMLNIPLDDFVETTSIYQRGNLAFHGLSGFVEDGFAFKSPGHVYYGTLETGMIKELCVDFFDSMDEEINSVLSKYNILLVAWCRGMISSA